MFLEENFLIKERLIKEAKKLAVNIANWNVLWAFPLFFLIYGILGGASVLRLPSAADIKLYPVENSPLEGESPLMIQEFFQIVDQYQRISPGAAATKRRIQTQRNLLERLNRMQAQTAFLQGQKTILQASLRNRLRIAKASEPLFLLAKESPEPSVRDDAVLTLVSQALKSNDQKMLLKIFNDTQSGLSYPLKSFIALLLRRRDHISANEAAYIVNYYMENMIEQYQDTTTLSRLIKDLQDKIKIEDIDKISDKFLSSGQGYKALPFIRLRVSSQEYRYEDLLALGLRFKREESSFATMLRGLPNKTEAMEQYLKLYQDRVNARSRGRSFNILLNRYRGIKKYPYNVAAVDKIFSDYLSGAVEDRYITDNTERAVRNLLSQQRFDLIAKYLTLAKEKIWRGFYSPYLNFWLAYARMQTGETNEVAELLSEIVSENPETYFGMMAVELLTRIFKEEPAGSEIKRRLFWKIKEGMSSTNKSLSIGAAVAMYYLGSGLDKGQAEHILVKEQLINTGSKAFSKQGMILSEAYLALGLQNAARRILYREGINTPQEQDIIFSSLYESNDETVEFSPTFSRKRSVLLGGMPRLIGTKMLKAYYPRPFSKQVAHATDLVSNNVDENLVYAIIRQESFYKTNARSHAGARGLMQLMPATARFMARQVLDDPQNYSLFDPQINILLGTSYLSQNIKSLGVIPALAAYNGGPGRVKEVKERYSPKNTFEFIEVHPIKETRTYMRKVLEHYNRYSVIYNGHGLKLSEMSDSLF